MQFKTHELMTITDTFKYIIEILVRKSRLNLFCSSNCFIFSANSRTNKERIDLFMRLKKTPTNISKHNLRPNGYIPIPGNLMNKNMNIFPLNFRI